MQNHELLKAAYAAFNLRDIDAALAAMHPQVEWANGMEGGTVRGQLAVREYWTRQWGVINPHVEPLSFEGDATGRVVVKRQRNSRPLPKCLQARHLTLRDGSFGVALSQALRARLRSHRPFGTFRNRL